MSILKNVPVVSGVFQRSVPASIVTAMEAAVEAEPIVIYFGSQSGTAEAFSRIIHKELHVAGIPSRVEDLEKFDPITFGEHKLVILVVATTGEGDATDNAKKFNRFLSSKSTAPDCLKGLKYCVFGLGDLNYINFNHMGKRTEKNMERLGGVRIHYRGIGDSSQDIEADLRHWIDAGLIESIRENFPNLRRTGSKPLIISGGVPSFLQMVVSSDLPVRCDSSTVSVTGETLSKVFYSLRSVELVGRNFFSPDPFSTCELTLGEDMFAADDPMTNPSIEILPRNSIETVGWAINRFPTTCTLSDVIDFVGPSDPPFPVPCTLEFALLHYIDFETVGALSSTFLSNLSLICDTVADVKTVSLLNLVQFCDQYAPELTMSEFLQLAPKQKVRPYTAAGKNRILVAQSGGVCSNFLARKISIGEKLLVRSRPSAFVFAPDEPLLVVATGAGIAPFMAAMELTNSKKIHLVYGCRDNEDFLHREEILAWEKNGRITCNLAFSNQRPDYYVQHIVKEDKAIHRMIAEIASGEKGRIFVCGRTSMGRAVCEAIAAQLGGQTQLEQLAARGALCVEFFG